MMNERKKTKEATTRSKTETLDFKGYRAAVTPLVCLLTGWGMVEILLFRDSLVLHLYPLTQIRQ